MKHKKVRIVIALSLLSACGLALLLLGARHYERERSRARLPIPPHLSACKSLAHPILPERFRATYLMAPFSSGQLVIGEIVHDGPLSATRFTLYGVERGVTDFMVMGDNTYLLSSTTTNEKNCTALGDTGWRSLPKDWLNNESRCAGSGPVHKMAANWWATTIEYSKSNYWIWSKQSDGTPFRLVFPYPIDRLAPLSQFAFSHQIAFLAVERTDLEDIASFCRESLPVDRGRAKLTEAIDAMKHSPVRDDAAIKRLFPSLKHECEAPTEPLWNKKITLTGMLTPFDAKDDPVPIEMLYDWSVPGMRTRMFPRGSNLAALDALLLEAGGYNVSHRTDGAIMCTPGLPGTVRPDWSQRAPCTCRAEIAFGTELSPDQPIQILSCPLNAPRIAWSWYTHSGKPDVFMVTSIRGDEGLGSFATLDYHEWATHLPVAAATFVKPKECPDSPIMPAGIAAPAVANCKTCHSSAANP